MRRVQSRVAHTARTRSGAQCIPRVEKFWRILHLQLERRMQPGEPWIFRQPAPSNGGGDMAHPSWRAPGDRRRTLAASRLTAGPMDGLEARLKVSVLRLDEPHHDR